MPIDPVCRRHLDVAHAAASYDFHDLTVYFCSVECEKQFEKNPEAYMRGMSDEEKISA